jgi:hypothetical protein
MIQRGFKILLLIILSQEHERIESKLLTNCQLNAIYLGPRLLPPPPPPLLLELLLEEDEEDDDELPPLQPDELDEGVELELLDQLLSDEPLVWFPLPLE